MTMPGLMSVTTPDFATPACIRLSRKKPVPDPISSARPYGVAGIPAISSNRSRAYVTQRSS